MKARGAVHPIVRLAVDLDDSGNKSKGKRGEKSCVSYPMQFKKSAWG